MYHLVGWKDFSRFPQRLVSWDLNDQSWRWIKDIEYLPVYVGVRLQTAASHEERNTGQLPKVPHLLWHKDNVPQLAHSLLVLITRGSSTIRNRCCFLWDLHNLHPHGFVRAKFQVSPCRAQLAEVHLKVLWRDEPWSAASLGSCSGPAPLRKPTAPEFYSYQLWLKIPMVTFPEHLLDDRPSLFSVLHTFSSNPDKNLC